MINASSSFAKHPIQGIETTDDLLVDRAGLAFFTRYISASGLIERLVKPFEGFRLRANGVSPSNLLGQLLAFFADGTSRHLKRFDELKKDKAYSALLGLGVGEALSSDQIERFFRKMTPAICSPLRHLLRSMFARRLKVERPQIVELFLDTMVMDNDDALARQGCEPTYKKVKGFQPLQLIWNGWVVDAQFRGGKKNGNHGNTAKSMILKAVDIIRQQLGHEVPIIVRMDGGFYDGKLFKSLDLKRVGFVCTGRLSKVVTTFAAGNEIWKTLDIKKQTWSVMEFGHRCKSWKRWYRAFLVRPHFEDDQRMFCFARPDRVIVTNLGSEPFLFMKVPNELKEPLFEMDQVIGQHHAKGLDELTHRAIKSFGFEQLPFKKFAANSAFYYLMIIAYNMFEAFKRDVLVPLDLSLPKGYAVRTRRTVFDVAGKIVRTARKTVLKLTNATMRRLRGHELWSLSGAPPD